jgi:hypothetical protein
MNCSDSDNNNMAQKKFQAMTKTDNLKYILPEKVHQNNYCEKALDCCGFQSCIRRHHTRKLIFCSPGQCEYQDSIL